jgi:hypothetical protein
MNRAQAAMQTPAPSFQPSWAPRRTVASEEDRIRGRPATRLRRDRKHRPRSVKTLALIIHRSPSGEVNLDQELIRQQHALRLLTQ